MAWGGGGDDGVWLELMQLWNAGETDGKVWVEVTGRGREGSLPSFLTYFGHAVGCGGAGRGAAREGGLVHAGALNLGKVSSVVSGLPHLEPQGEPIG